MHAESPAPISPTSLEQAIRQQILQRTWRRIRGLAVDVTARGVFIRGSVLSYYTKQLALLAVREVLGAKDPTRLELDIRVQPCHGLAGGGDDN